MKYYRPIFTALSYGTLSVLALTAFPALAVETDPFDKGMQPVLTSYLRIQEALAADSTDGVQAAARSIAEDTATLEAESFLSDYPDHYRYLPVALRSTAEALSTTESLEVAREAFKLLSKPMVMWGTMSQPAGVDVIFCSMANSSWLQRHGEVRNPYYGKSMIACGKVMSAGGHGMQSMGKHDHNDGAHSIEPVGGRHDDARHSAELTNHELHQRTPQPAVAPAEAHADDAGPECIGRACGGS